MQILNAFWTLIARKRRIKRLNFFDWLSNVKSSFFKWLEHVQNVIQWIKIAFCFLNLQKSPSG